MEKGKAWKVDHWQSVAPCGNDSRIGRAVTFADVDSLMFEVEADVLEVGKAGVKESDRCHERGDDVLPDWLFENGKVSVNCEKGLMANAGQNPVQSSLGREWMGILLQGQ